MGIKIESINGLCNIINVYSMKTFYIIAILFLFTFFTSCETVSIQFTESQPSHKTKRSKIPKRIHGYYLRQGNGNKSENRSLRISEQSIVLYRTESITASKAEIFKELGREVNDDSLIIIANNKFENVQVSFIKHTDSVNLIIPENDTLFVFQENYALKKYKNKWFINQKTAQSNWTTTVLWNELNSIYNLSYDSAEISPMIEVKINSDKVIMDINYQSFETKLTLLDEILQFCTSLKGYTNV